MSLTAAARGFLACLSSLSVVHGQDGWEVKDPKKICAVEGGALPSTCIYRTNNELIELWFTQEGTKAPVDLIKASNHTKHFWNHCNTYSCNLQRTNLTRNDSGFYKLKFKTDPSPGYCSEAFQLYVTDLRVEVTKSNNLLGPAHLELKCQNSCPLHPVYRWFNNGRVMTSETSSVMYITIQSQDSFSCALQGFEKIPSAAVYMPKLPVVSVSPNETTAGMTATLTCSSDANPAAAFSWFKKQHIGNVSSGEHLVFRAIQPSDSGHYYCKAVNKLGSKLSEYIRLSVKYAPTRPSLKNEGRTQDPDRADASTGKYIEAVVISAVLLTLVFVSVLLWFCKRRASKESSEDRPDNADEGLPDAAKSEDKHQVHYASVHFINNQTESLYSNIGAHHTRRHVKEDETEYSTITMNSAALRA